MESNAETDTHPHQEFIADETNTRIVGVKTIEVSWDKDANGRWVMKEVEGSEQILQADLVLLAMGFLGPEKKIVEVPFPSPIDAWL